ncbi:hypothetical protein KVR01_000164 [Diaporthe batatas]|uniref:uncharacterized protein n=1 Tax=Diaporthe batatas TaxID=748121 RepID=UPI001D047084|nr:uncharacterized protein KVR01_000164 [Diaporthe batatas]KAG8169419.1 hypothetical protein KVR01_000164 [Diaporthe batatas]
MATKTKTWLRPLAGVSALITASLIPSLCAGATGTEHTVQATHNEQLTMGSDEILTGTLPSLHLLMKPIFNESTQGPDGRPEPIAINITMKLRVPRDRFGADTPLLSLPLMVAKTPTASYGDDNPLTASVNNGDFHQLEYFDDDRITAITVKFTAPYRRTDEKTLPGPRIDLRRDVTGGGLVGQGEGFIPIPPPPSKEKGKRETWQSTVEWDLADAPSGVHGAWSLGDDHVSSAIGTMEFTITHAIFAVGYLRRSPEWDIDTTSWSGEDSGNTFAMYWFDPSPYDMVDLAKSTRAIYARIAAYFDNSTDPFRVFFRQIEANSGGTGASFSFMVEYSLLSVDQTDEHALADLIAHETVHEFALLDEALPGESPPEWQEDEAAWYVEGVASYVGALAGLNDPFRRKWMVKSMNNYAQAYYTSPVVRLPYDDVLSNYWDSVDITRVSYYRGLIFLAELDGMLWSKSQGKRSMDDVIVDLYKLRRDGQPCSLMALKEKVAGLIGQENLDRSYDAMFKGDLIVPSEECLERYGLKLVKMKWHKFELGFETQSMREFKVRGLVPGSAADKAGVKEGDVIVKGFMVWIVEDELDVPMRIVVLRNGKEVQIEWWPRSDEVVEAYGWVDDRDPSGLYEL